MSGVVLEGVLISCDAAMKELILKIDVDYVAEQHQGDREKAFIINKDLGRVPLARKDDPQILQMIQEKIEEVQKKNSFSRPNLQEAAETKQGPPSKRKKSDGEREDTHAVRFARTHGIRHAHARNNAHNLEMTTHMRL